MIKIDKALGRVAPVPDFSNYIITEFGDVYNKEGKKLKPNKSWNGYLRVSLSNSEVSHKHFLIHRLVAQVFVPNPLGLPQVNHKNENKQDNRAANLEWCSPLYNLEYSGVIEKASIKKFKSVICETTGEFFPSIKEAADKYGLHYSNITACCRGRKKTSGGKKWRYADLQEDVA